MKKHYLLLSVILTLCSSVFAGTVSEQNAQTVALNFFKLYAPNLSGVILTATLKYTKAEDNGSVDFYVFDIAPVKGFVIVTGYDNLEPVIAYSTESNFATNVDKIGVKDWMETSAANINYALRAGVVASAQITNKWTAYNQGLNPGSERATSVGPLCTTTWDQENDISTPPPYLYNLLCPFNSTDNERAVTGCVATAMAQIMKYWNYPPTGTGSYSYTYTPTGYPTQSANFGATTYQWANMPSALSLTTTGAQDSAVDVLSYQCGVAVAMEYGDDNQGGSGAYVIQSDAGTGQPCAQQAYPKYFGYNSSTIQGLHSSSYTASAWTNLIEGELNAGRVVQYAGQDPGVGGHTWVCDGYNTSGLFHMNWGWNGIDNGYFSLTNLNPSPYKFNSDDEALIGIEPGTTSTCSAPGGLSTTNVGTGGATFGWSAVSGASSYNIQYQVVGATTWTTATATTNTYTAAGLASGTNYQWEVQTVCSGGLSAFSSGSTFTTTGTACNVPTGLSAAVTGTGATLSWATATGAVTYSLEWKAASATGWTTVTGITTNSYPLSGLSSCTSYQYAVQSVCSTGSSAYSSTASLTTTGCAITYCASSASTQTYEYIKNVTLGSINNTTTAAGYGNYTSQSTNLAGNTKATITLTPGFVSSAYSEYFTVYIDYNQNGVFTDAGETVAKVSGKAAVSTSFTVPTTALNGPTRMRVQMQYGAYETNPCASFTYGGVQDYTVNITGNASLTIGAPGESAADMAGMKLYPNPAQNDLTIQFNSGTDGNVKMNVYNLTGQRVISNENSAATGTNIVDVNTSQLANGVYIFELENNGQIERQKFVITR